MQIDDDKLMAWIDGELDAAGAAQVEAAIARNEALAARAEAQRRLKRRLAGHYAPIAQEEAPARLRAMLESGEAEIVDLSAVRERRRGRWAMPQFAAMAASLALGLLIGRSALVGGEGDALTAPAPVAAALDAQLASTQTADAPIHIGLSFRNRDGDYCRTFAAERLEGIACREDGDWRLAMALAVDDEMTQPQYRQAGSGGAVMREARAMMDGRPLDAEAEHAAAESGWD